MEYLDYTLHIVLVGDSKVGKTSFLNFLNKKSSKNPTETIGVDVTSLYYNIHDKNIKLSICDTTGQERFLSIVTAYFRKICSIILLFDISEPQTFSNLEKWLELVEYEKICAHTHPILLIGNKTDLPNKTDYNKLNQFINKYDLIYREISCKQDYDLEETMGLFISRILNTLNHDACIGLIKHDANRSSISLKSSNRNNISTKKNGSICTIS